MRDETEAESGLDSSFILPPSSFLETEDAPHIFFKIRHLFPRLRAVYEVILPGDHYELVRCGWLR